MSTHTQPATRCTQHAGSAALCGVYFITQTITTVGLGDIVPQTKGLRLFVVVYVPAADKRRQNTCA